MRIAYYGDMAKARARLLVEELLDQWGELFVLNEKGNKTRTKAAIITSEWYLKERIRISPDTKLPMVYDDNGTHLDKKGRSVGHSEGDFQKEIVSRKPWHAIAKGHLDIGDGLGRHVDTLQPIETTETIRTIWENINPAYTVWVFGAGWFASESLAHGKMKSFGGVTRSPYTFVEGLNDKIRAEFQDKYDDDNYYLQMIEINFFIHMPKLVAKHTEELKERKDAERTFRYKLKKRERDVERREVALQEQEKEIKKFSAKKRKRKP